MKVILKDSRRYLLRLDKGERFMESLAQFMEQNAVKACSFSAIGTGSDLELGYYNGHIKEYRKKRFLEDFEIVSLNGNGSLFVTDSKPMVHAHGSFSRTDFSVVGGHIFEMLVLATCEIFIIVLDGEMKRENNLDFNLNLLV